MMRPKEQSKTAAPPQQWNDRPIEEHWSRPLCQDATRNTKQRRRPPEPEGGLRLGALTQPRSPFRDLQAAQEKQDRGGDPCDLHHVELGSTRLVEPGKRKRQN